MLEVRFGAQPFAGTLQRDTAEIEQRPVVRPDLALALKPLDGAVVGLNRLLEALLGAQQVTLARQRLVGLRPPRGPAIELGQRLLGPAHPLQLVGTQPATDPAPRRASRPPPGG